MIEDDRALRKESTNPRRRYTKAPLEYFTRLSETQKQLIDQGITEHIMAYHCVKGIILNCVEKFSKSFQDKQFL